MKKLVNSLVSLGVLVLLSNWLIGIGYCTELIKSVYFYENELVFDVLNGYQVPKLNGCNFIPNPGEPQLPVRAIYFLLPPGTKVKEVKVGKHQAVSLPGEYDIYPSQPPQPLIKSLRNQRFNSCDALPAHYEKIEFVAPKAEVYELAHPYPGKLVEFVGEGTMRGYRIAGVLVYPLQWTPKTKELKLYTEIEIRVELIELPIHKVQATRYKPHPIVERLIKSFVINPEAVNVSMPSDKIAPLQQGDGYEYLIITSEGVVNEFTPFAKWKTSKGVPAVIRTTSWINANYSGRDLAEKIRNFIKVAAQDSGVIWVLLGGDTPVVPARVAYAMTSEAGVRPDEDSIRADLYYSDLDGTWDVDNDRIYGEVEDSVDLYPDVFVGRTPNWDGSQVRTFINKVMTYELNPPTAYLKDALFMAEVLWNNPYTDGGISKDMIGELFPPGFNIVKLYESQGNENRATVIAEMNEGKALLNHNGHAWYNVMCVGPDHLTCTDMDNLRNGNKQGILYSIGCWPAAFDYDCIAEHWILNPNGGGVAFIGNSRYGWGSPGNPRYGYSDKLDESFYYNLFKENVTNIGATLAKTKIKYIAYSHNENVWRYHQYQLNLLGDPEMDIWTDMPATFTVSYPESVSIGASVFKVSVGVEDALVCCEKEGEVYERGLTNEAGEVSFNIQPTSVGNLQVCITHHNYLPHRGIVKVYSTGPYPGYYSYTIADSDGNGEVNPNEVINLLVTLKNYGNQPANNVTATLTTTDPVVTILDGSGNFGIIPAGETAQSEFRFRVGSCSNGHIIEFKLRVAGFGKFGLNFVVKTPYPSYEYYAVNTTPEPGDTIELWIVIKNTGGLAPDTKCKIKTLSPYLVLIDTLNSFGTLGANFVVSRPYRVGISPGCPSPYFVPIVLELSSAGYSFADTFTLSIGRITESFFDNFETGAPGWLHGGVLDLWNVTTRNSHSATHSWYCGSTASWRYGNNMNCWLRSPTIILGPNSWLSFWSYFEVAIYGVDGIYPIIKRGAIEDTLDFIGSGGALRSLVVDWAKYSYDLSSYPVGCTLQVKFRFVSDSATIAEGFYIDDVRIGEYETPPELWLTLWNIEDSLGNNDGIADPGESIFVYVWLINKGTTSVFTAAGHTSCTDPYVTFLPWDSLEFGDIFGRRVVRGFFSFTTSPSTPVGHEICFNLNVARWSFPICFPVGVGGEEDKKIIAPYFICLPNPFKNYTVIEYLVPAVAEKVPVSIRVYDIAGRKVETLVDKLVLPGAHKLYWETRKITSGIYFAKFEVPGYTATHKLIILK